MPKLLRHAARARGITNVGLRKPPAVPFPKLIVVDYLAYLLRILGEVKELVKKELLPSLPGMLNEANTRHDAEHTDATYVDALNRIVDKMGTEARKRAPTGSALEAQLSTFFRQTDEYAARGLQRQVKAVLGFDVVSAVPGMEAKSSVFVRQNVSLIKSIPETYLKDVEQTTLRAFRAGTRADDLAQELEDRFDVAKNSAALIAQDQIGKLNGEIVEDRQRSLGIDGYIWDTSDDERVRPEHAKREGVPFKWNDPPEDGHPGQAIRCRCVALPDLSDVVD